MTFKELILILKHIYRDYVKYHLNKIFIALILSIIIAGTSSGTAWLLDPAVKKIFIDQNTTLSWLIPLAIIFVFSAESKAMMKLSIASLCLKAMM